MTAVVFRKSVVDTWFEDFEPRHINLDCCDYDILVSLIAFLSYRWFEKPLTKVRQRFK